MEDDVASRLLMETILSDYGEVYACENGELGLEAFSEALIADAPYDLVCLDIEMPVMDGQLMLTELRTLETQRGRRPYQGVKVMMVTIHRDSNNVLTAFREQCDAFVVKPVDKDSIETQIKELGLI